MSFLEDWIQVEPPLKNLILMHGGSLPGIITQSGLTTGKSVHGEPKSKARESMYTNSIST